MVTARLGAGFVIPGRPIGVEFRHGPPEAGR
jgi:hypothetical protein